MRRVLITLAALGGALTVAAPAAAATPLDEFGIVAYEIRSASGYESVSFHGDGTDSCRKAGLCDVSGQARYEFRSRGRGFAGLFGLGTPDVGGFGGFSVSGTTTSSVSQTGASAACTDFVKHDEDSFTMEPKGRRILFGFHLDPYQPDYLRTHCAGPGESDLALARKLPQAIVSPKELVKRRLTVTLVRNGPFHVGAFSGTVDSRIVIVLRQSKRALDLLDLFDS
ncbi:MAG TPA: hypothetical protein VF752_02240 [Thermoleophilaceae bacterium]